MEKDTYSLLENYMLLCMGDSAHDREHIYRVLYVALEIARTLIYKGRVSEPLYSVGTDDHMMRLINY